MDADDTDFADLNDKDMDEEKINRLSEPELVYERRRTKISSQRFEKIEQEVWLQDFLRQLPENLNKLNNPVPYTDEELRARIDEAQAEIDAGKKGISPEELFRRASVIKRLRLCK